MSANMTVTNCRNCGKRLKSGEKENAEQLLSSYECAECLFHASNGTRAIDKYNEWLRPKE